jgi:hypothetical protein
MSADPWSMTASGSPVEIDAAEVSRAASLLLVGDRHEIRALPGGVHRYVAGSDPDGTVDAVRELASSRAVYFTLNDVDGRRDGSARNDDITRRLWFFLDIDPIKAEPDNSATDAEKKAAIELTWAIEERLCGLGWPAPIIVDSGNGHYLLYRCDLPNDAMVKALFASAIKSLADYHGCEGARIDKAVHNASRIARMPGTMNRKGVATADRPHRMCRVAYHPVESGLLTLDNLRAVTDKPTKGTEKPANDPWTATAGTTKKTAYLDRAMQGELLRVATAPPGERNTQLNHAAFRLGQLVPHGLNKFVVLAELRDAAKQVGLTDREIDQTLMRAVEAGEASPRTLPDSLNPTATTATAAPEIPSRLIVWAKDIVPKRVEWLWPNRIPLGKMTTFAGQGGLGKTFTLCDIAARVSRGDAWPFLDGECAEQGKVLFISGEDDEDDTLVPRLIQCGADTSRIAFLSPESQEHFSLAALELLSSVLDQMDGVRFVAIDPPSSYLGTADEHRNAEVRGLLTPIKHWCAQRRVSVVFNSHVNKAIGQNVDSAARVMGSVAWVNAVRAAHMFTKDPDARDEVLFTCIKLNVGAKPQGLAYKITANDGELARLEWLRSVDMDADEAARGERKPRGVIAEEFFTDLFRQRREWPALEMIRQCQQAGISKNSRVQACERLPLKWRHAHDEKGERFVEWYITDPHWPHAETNRNPGNPGNPEF